MRSRRQLMAALSKPIANAPHHSDDSAVVRALNLQAQALMVLLAESEQTLSHAQHPIVLTGAMAYIDEDDIADTMRDLN